jgi:arylsulfatase A-like enzyme
MLLRKQPNVLLIVLDATRADACSSYGNPKRTTPALDRLAAEGVLFEQAISAAPWTLPAMTSIFTGLYPSQTDIYAHRVLDSSIPTLSELLSAAGYGTFCITNNSWLSADFGLQRGFETVHRQWQWIQTNHEFNKLVLMERSREINSNWLQVIAHEVFRGSLFANLINAVFIRTLAYRGDSGASRMMRPFTQWVSSQDKPWFACVHYLESHLPYKPPKEWVKLFTDDLEHAQYWLERDQLRAAWRYIADVEDLSQRDRKTLRDLYYAEVAYTDYQMGVLLEWLEARGHLDKTVVIIVADHGDNLGEHGLMNHQYCVYDTLIRVPLVLHYPRALPVGKRISQQVQTLDVFQTVLDLASISSKPTASYNLFDKDRRDFTVTEYGKPRLPHRRNLERFGLVSTQIDQFQRGLTALRSDPYKLIVATDGQRELYNWRDDPSEDVNLVSLYPETVARLEKYLDRWRKEHARLQDGEMTSEEDINPETEERLRALGYLE